MEVLYKNLENYSDLDLDDNCENFLDTVDKIVAQNDPKSIPILLKYFDDNSDYDWILESLSSAIEHLPGYYLIAMLYLMRYP